MSSSNRTSFSSYKDPRPAPVVPISPTGTRSQTPVLRRTASESSIIPVSQRGKNGGLNLNYDYFAFRYGKGSVREGYIEIQYDKLRSWSWTHRLWVVLDDALLHFCRKKDAEPSESVRLHQVHKVERVNARGYCLMVAAPYKTWYFSFADAVTMNDWYYDMRIRCPLMRIGLPTDFRHDLHVTYDHVAQEITGLPEAWIQTLSSWGVAPALKYDQRPPRPPAVNIGPMTTSKQMYQIPPSRGPPSAWQPLVPERRQTSRFRSTSDATVYPVSRPPSTIASTEHFRRSPLRYRDVEARDLTGSVRQISSLPTSRHENCDIWKGDWTGSFGTRTVAIHIVRLPDPVIETDLLSALILQEVKVLHQLRHPNVVRTRGFCTDLAPLPALVSTWISGGHILDYVRDKQPSFKKLLKLKLLAEVASGLNYLHNFSREIVHGELRAANVLINSKGCAVLTGFGLNPILRELVDARKPSPRWAATEVIRLGRSQISYRSDVFSFGRLVLEVMTEKEPYHYLNDMEVATVVVRGVPPRRPPVFADDGIWHFLERCWKDAPSQRPSMAAAILRIEDVLRMYQPPVNYGYREPPGSIIP